MNVISFIVSSTTEKIYSRGEATLNLCFRQDPGGNRERIDWLVNGQQWEGQKYYRRISAKSIV